MIDIHLGKKTLTVLIHSPAPSHEILEALKSILEGSAYGMEDMVLVPP